MNCSTKINCSNVHSLYFSPRSYLCDAFDIKWSKSNNLILGVCSENLPMRISNTELICADRFLIDQKYLVKSIYLFKGSVYQTSCLTVGLSQSNLLKLSAVTFRV